MGGVGLDYILEGLEAELALERELGVRSIEFDRSLLASPSPASAHAPAPPVRPGPVRPVAAPPAAAVYPPPSVQHPSGAPGATVPVVFLHHRPLPPAGEEMMAKIIAALGLDEARAKVVVEPPMPPAKIYVVLGGLALRKWFPGQNAAPGQWLRTDGGRELLVTNSPEYILRFKTVTPALQRIKRDMWTSIKGILKRI